MRHRSSRLVVAFVGFLTLVFPVCAAEDLGEGRAILVTGASTGIGRATAELLAEHGFYVYAGARKQEDLDALNAIENIEAVRLDVTRQEEIDDAVRQVEAGGRGLYGLINNAGVAVIAPMIEITDDDLEFQFDVNVYGVVRVTRAFAPMLIESKGRISTTSSISGFVCWGLGGAYTMSKHAVEAYTDTLAMELAPFGVDVSVIEPGNYRSKIGENRIQRMLEQGYTTEGSLYKDSMDRLMAMGGDRSSQKDPREVAEAFLHAMTDDSPKLRYLVTPNAEEAQFTLMNTMRRVVQLNEDHPYTMDREALIAMLDEALKEQDQIEEDGGE